MTNILMNKKSIRKEVDFCFLYSNPLLQMGPKKEPIPFDAPLDIKFEFDEIIKKFRGMNR
jgi:hypothetical protein